MISAIITILVQRDNRVRIRSAAGVFESNTRGARREGSGNNAGSADIDDIKTKITSRGIGVLHSQSNPAVAIPARIAAEISIVFKKISLFGLPYGNQNPDCLSHARSLRLREKLRNRDCDEDTQNRHHQKKFDQRKTFFHQITFFKEIGTPSKTCELQNIEPRTFGRGTELAAPNVDFKNLIGTGYNGTEHTNTNSTNKLAPAATPRNKRYLQPTVTPPASCMGAKGAAQVMTPVSKFFVTVIAAVMVPTAIGVAVQVCPVPGLPLVQA